MNLKTKRKKNGTGVKAKAQTRKKFKTFGCSICGEVATEKEHLCNPVKQAYSWICGDCDDPKERAESIFMTDPKNMKFYCNSCGRVSDETVVLCHPRKLDSTASQ